MCEWNSDFIKHLASLHRNAALADFYFAFSGGPDKDEAFKIMEMVHGSDWTFGTVHSLDDRIKEALDIALDNYRKQQMIQKGENNESATDC